MGNGGWERFRGGSETRHSGLTDFDSSHNFAYCVWLRVVNVPLCVEEL